MDHWRDRSLPRARLHSAADSRPQPFDCSRPFFRARSRLGAPTLRDYLNVVVPRSVKRATHIVAVSQATKNDLIEFYNTPQEKISVIYEGVDEKFKPTVDKAKSEKYKLGERPYIFSVSTIHPRKNFKRLMQAFAQLPKDFDLVIAGGKGWLYDDIFAEAQKNKGRVRFLGFVPDDDLPALYSGAAMFAYPSLYEGFGLPLLEAMACGTPTLSSNVSCLPEVAGGAAVTVSPYDVDSIAEGLKHTLANRSELIKKVSPAPHNLNGAPPRGS